MDLKQLQKDFDQNRALQEKAVFASLFILQNKVKTFFDNSDSKVTLKQFMLLVIVKQAKLRKQQLSFTQIGELLGCSRQNVKKLALVLEKHGWCNIVPSESDSRTSVIEETAKLMEYFSEISTYHMHKLEELFAVFSDEELQVFFQLMNKFNNHVNEMEKQDE